MSDPWGCDDTPASAPATNGGGGGDDWGTGGGDLQFGSKGRTRNEESSFGGFGGGGGGGGGDRGCFNCNQPGHMSRDCPEPKKERGGGGGGACYNCGGDGHMSRDCPQPRKEGARGGPGGSACFNCNEEGHMSRDCPNPRKPQLGPDGEERPPAHRPDDVNLDEEEAMKIDQGINFDRFDKIEVDVKGGKLQPINEFKDLISSELLLQNIQRAGYKRMTPIQRYTIPALANNQDVVGCAQTGSGKTAAFLLPVLQTILNEREPESQYGAECQRPYCIVIAPTRELARQTYVEAMKLSRDSIVKCQCIYGGTQTGHLRAQLSKGTHILCATPGRLKDFINRGWIGLDKVKYVILDEGDRLIDDGFVVDMRAMFTNPQMPPASDRQTLFFSATFKQEAQSIAKEFMKPNFLFITVGMVGAANEDVKQEFVKVERSHKKKELLQILQKNPDDKVIVFTQTKATADIISSYLTSMGVQCTSIHGDRHQSQREEALAHFKRGIRRCLVASPVGERGLDLPKVSIVINYDMPNELDEYVHRIGRTGRIGNTGRAISFFDPERDNKIIGELTRALKQAQQEVPDFFDNPATHSSDFDSFAGNGFGDKENTNSVSAGDAAGGGDEEW